MTRSTENPGLTHGTKTETAIFHGGCSQPTEPSHNSVRREVAVNCATEGAESGPEAGSANVDPGRTMGGAYGPSRCGDLTGQIFGKLTVVGLAGRNVHRNRMWLCQCECGGTSTPTTAALRKGNSKSCGCMSDIGARTRTHGARNTPEYQAWAGMRNRCFRTKDPGYKHYGAKGVTVAPEWRNDFAAFLDHIGPRPSAQHSIDRHPNPRGNYEPGNVRWATVLEQQNNRRDNGRLYLGGVSITIPELARALGLPYLDVYRKLMVAWPSLAVVVESAARPTTDAAPGGAHG